MTGYKLRPKDRILARIPWTGGINQAMLNQALAIKSGNIHRMLLELERDGLIVRSLDSGEMASNCKARWTRVKE